MDSEETASQEKATGSLNQPVSLTVLLVLFFVCGFFASMPCLCLDGVAKAKAKGMLFALIWGWMMFQVWKKKLTKVDVIIYALIFGGFVILVENLRTPIG